MDVVQLALIFLTIVIVASIFFSVSLTKKKKIENAKKSRLIKGHVDRYGYCTKTPKGWGYWVLQLKEQKEPIIIYPHQHKNHNELALTRIGDRIEVRYYVYQDGNESLLIANDFKNLDYDSN